MHTTEFSLFTARCTNYQQEIEAFSDQEKTLAAMQLDKLKQNKGHPLMPLTTRISDRYVYSYL